MSDWSPEYNTDYAELVRYISSVGAVWSVLVIRWHKLEIAYQLYYFLI